ncbi:MAG: ParB/RepB/Spo0J family partition protein [Alphaproteobacteria bacterium]|nr:ParB/RepB/Spo0J family partition protein [Alphaproteobacteria bacterium]MBR2482871.1 ParB/RepB/Spo0J family partition protein [Alphaproteobacteria bacterium]
MSPKFGLGRGLADLKSEMGEIPNISVLTGGERVIVKQIPLVQIGANPDQPRKTFTDAELNDLAASIKEKGVLQPILLRTVQNRPYMYEIVAGERRYRASKLAGLTEIPALVKTLTNENAMEIALIENVQRENLNPIEEANAYKNLMESCDYELADVVRLIGKSESYIRNSLRLTSLPDSVKSLVEQGDLSASHARTIAVAENPEELAHKIIADKISVAETEILVKQGPRSASRRTHVQKTMDVATVRDIEARLKKALNVPVKLTERRGGAGQITLSFATRVQLQELVEKITHL